MSASACARVSLTPGASAFAAPVYFGATPRFALAATDGLRLGDNANNPALTRKEAVTLIRGAGLAAAERLADDVLEEVP